MPEPRPTGTVTFLFTDIEGSTQLWEHHHAWMDAAHHRHEAILRAAISAHSGWAYKQIGDAFQAAFQTAAQALAAAVAAQQALAAEPWGGPRPIRVRMGLHTGTTEERADDYLGPLLNRVARLMSAGHGGQVLLTAATCELLRDALPAGVTLRDLGERRLKDLIRPERVWQVVVEGLPADFPPLKTLDTTPSNLPVQLTPLVGRESEVAEVCALLGQPGVHLLTLTGPGGIGKTRLGLQVAAEMLDAFPDGIYFVALAAITDVRLVLPAIAQTLRVQEEGGEPLAGLLKARLHKARMLLLLDNFEQVAAAAPAVADLLSAGPGLKALVTSREALRVRGEHEFPVPPLSLPDPKSALTVAQLQRSEAIRLFVERASEVRRDFVLTGQNAPAVAEICARLDGLPLAIELAAARTKLIPPQLMLSRLSSRLKLLTGGARDLPARQQTLRGAIAWSYDLLDESDQELFSRLAVFVGGCTLDAAEAICGGGVDPGLSGLDVFDGLASLVNKSLTRQSETADGGVRFSMLETIREYAVEKLDEGMHGGVLRRGHADYFLALAMEAEQGLRSERQREWFERLETEIDNFRAAVGWALVQGEEATVARLGAALWRFLWTYGYLSEGRRWLEASLQSPSLPPAVRAKALYPAGIMAYEQGDIAHAERFFQESLAIQRELGDKPGIADLLNALGRVAKHKELYDQAAAYFQESLALRLDLGDRHGMSVALNNLGSVAHCQKDYDQAVRMYEQSLQLEREFGDTQGIAEAVNNLAEVAADQRDPARAAELYLESLQLCRELGDKHGMLVSLEGLAVAAGAQQQAERATTLFGACATLREMSGTQMEHSYEATYALQIAEARARVGEAVWTVARDHGRAMSFEDACDYALRGAAGA